MNDGEAFTSKWMVRGTGQQKGGKQLKKPEKSTPRNTLELRGSTDPKHETLDVRREEK